MLLFGLKFASLDPGAAPATKLKDAPKEFSAIGPLDIL
jgi:hypothetical protein